jgi:hypothetical protein
VVENLRAGQPKDESITDNGPALPPWYLPLAVWVIIAVLINAVNQVGFPMTGGVQEALAG